MLKIKTSYTFAFALLFGLMASALLIGQTVHAANAEIDPDAKPYRVNRMTIQMGNVFLYDGNTTDNDWTFHGIGLTCSATIKYTPSMSAGESGTTPEKWTLTYTKKQEAGDGCGTDNTKSLSKPSNWTERQYVVFAGGDSDGQIISVKPDSGATFKEGGTYNGNKVYIQQGVDPYSCPLVIRKNTNWALIPLEKKDNEDDVSNQIRALFDKELGVGDTDCGPTDNDDLKILEQFGLPESYYDAGSEKDHYLKTDFGFDGEDVAGVDLDDIGILPIAQAAGIALNGPLKGGGFTGLEDGNSDGAVGGSDNDKDTTSCGVDGVGWIICPVMDFMGKLNDAAFGFIDNFLYVEPRLLTDKDTQAAWSNFRDLANIAFIIAFLVIVYSQITGAGVSNYGIKRMLPRIFIAALLVNLSYFICQIAVDLSNIAGSSLYSFFKDIPTTDAITATAESMPSWQKIIAFILIGTGVVAVGLLAISAIGTAALLAFVLVMLILIARKALLIILVVIAPLAFVAYLLPNTEKWFKGWWKMFSTLLMVFPIVAVIFGASTLAARIINNAGGEPDESNYMLQITALGVMALPLFAIPAVLKGAMSAAGSIGGRLQGMADKSQSKAAGKVKDRYESSVAGQYMKFRSGEADKRRALIQSGAYSGRGGKLNPRNLRAGAMKRVNTANLPGSVGEFGDRLAASGAALENKMWDEEVGRQRDLITVGKNMTNEQILKEMQAGSGGAEYQAALGSVIMKRNHRESHLKALEVVRTRQEAASLSGNTQEAGIVSGMQKQMLHDGAANMPWAVGDQAMGAMENGVWGAAGQAGHGKTLNEQMQSRVGTHMSVANLAKMNPDELKSVHKMAKNGQLSAGELATLQKAITELRVDEQYKGSEKPNATGLYDEILSGSYAPDPTTGTGSKHYNESDVF